MKKTFVLVLISLVFLTGCSIEQIDENNIDIILDTFLNKNLNLYNQVSSGYKYYLPRGIRVVDNAEYNEKLYADGNIYYFYVDVVSYYFKKVDNYTEKEDIYYSKRLEHNNKKGYIQITKNKELYFVEMLYNYAKIETLVAEKDIKQTVINATYILNSLNFNDKIIEKSFDETLLNFNEEQFKLFEPKRKTGDFLDYEEEYGKYEETIDEDLIVPNDESVNDNNDTTINQFLE